MSNETVTETNEVYLTLTADGDSLGILREQDATAKWLARVDEAHPDGAPHRIVKCTETVTRTPWVDVSTEGDSDGE